MYCRNCGKELTEGAVYCTNCATPVRENPVQNPGKNRVVVGLMALFLGTLGIHNFYLGYKNRALAQILISTVGGLFSCGIATLAVAVWSPIESIQIFTGTIATDAAGVPLHD